MLQKQATPINFANGLDTKTDPKQVQLGKFLALQNSIFDKGGLLQKRNGYGSLTALPNNSSTYLTTLNDNLTAIGTSINAYGSGSGTWVSKGVIQPMQVNTLSLIRNSVNQIQCDAAVASNGLVCTVYTETNGGSTSYKYAVADSTTGQNIVAPTVIPVASGTVTGSPRVFLLGAYFIVAFTNVISATSHLQYIAISTTNPANVTANADIASSYVSSTTLSWDAVTVNNALYFAYNTTTGGQAIKMATLSATLNVSTAVTFAGRKATLMTVTSDNTNPTAPIIYASFYDSSGSTGYTLAVDKNLNTVLAPTEIIASGTFLNLASAAQNGVVTVFGEVSNNYSYDSGIPTHYIDAVTVTQAGTVGTPYVAVRSVGLASKAFIVNGTIYFLAAYQSSYQPTYFLIDGSTSTAASPVVAGKLAYSNGGGYLTLGLPSAGVANGNDVQIGYLFKDLIAAVNKGTALPTGTQVNGIYSQTGINLGSFTIGTQGLDTAEIGSDLHISGGFLWMYDGYLPVEHNFFLWPDNVEVAGSGTSGSMSAQQYYYQVTYEWSDNQGNAFRSAPSIPVTVTLTSDTSVAINVPTLRLTYKTANPAKIVIYRWSVAQQVYYQVTSISAAQLNSTTADSITFTDTLADATILGNNILYTTGGVVEDVNAPATNIMTLFDTRLWIVDAEDQNLLWYSKQVIEATPVEMSDLFTIYVAPNTGTTSTTGPITALAPMDDKLVIGKKDALYYMNGSGPDNTGSNNQYSPVTFITSSVGCSNQQSLIMSPTGLMFQSDKGIWLLGRDLSTTYIGAPVEKFTLTSQVLSAVNVPGTNQIRFTMDSGITLVYDFFYQQWSTFVGVPCVSSCIFDGLHTFINAQGAAYQETPGLYVDGSNPVLMSFTTSWLNLAGLQGYQRAYEFYILGQYITPHKLQIGVAYDYNSSPQQSDLISPNNFSPTYGTSSPYGEGSYGGPDTLERWRVHLKRQRCQAFQITLQEVYDGSFGVPAGAGLTLSGLNVLVAVKKGWRQNSAATSVG